MQCPGMCELSFVQLCNSCCNATIHWVTCRDSGKDLMLLGFGISGLKLWHKLPEHSILFGPVSYNILDEHETFSEN